MADLTARNSIFGYSQGDADLEEIGVHAQRHGVEVLYRHGGRFLLYTAEKNSLEQVLRSYHKLEKIQLGYRCRGEREVCAVTSP